MHMPLRRSLAAAIRVRRRVGRIEVLKKGRRIWTTPAPLASAIIYNDSPLRRRLRLQPPRPAFFSTHAVRGAEVEAASQPLIVKGHAAAKPLLTSPSVDQPPPRKPAMTSSASASAL